MYVPGGGCIDWSWKGDPEMSVGASAEVAATWLRTALEVGATTRKITLYDCSGKQNWESVSESPRDPESSSEEDEDCVLPALW